MTTNDSFSLLSDDELLDETKRLAAIEREATADLIRSLAEIKTRGLHLAMGFSSMFGYCTRVLYLSEHAAYARIAAAKVATDFPLVMDLLIEGAINLTTVTLLGRHLTKENHVALLESARHKSKADVAVIVATLDPQPDVPSLVRKLPVASGDSVVQAIAPERYKLQVTISKETRAKLVRAQDLLRHTNRSADEATVIDRGLTLLVEQLEKVKYGRTARPRRAPINVQRPVVTSNPRSRYVPAHLRRAVSRRDDDRCAFVGSQGRCTETAGLQFHHRIPFADGGPTTLDNLELRCPAHNLYEAERWFGPLFVRETATVEGAWSGPSPSERDFRRRANLTAPSQGFSRGANDDGSVAAVDYDDFDSRPPESRQSGDSLALYSQELMRHKEALGFLPRMTS